MNPRALAALALAASVAATVLHADEPDAPATVRLRLADALARAALNAPRLRAAEGLQRAAEADQRGAAAARRPQAELQAGYSRLSDVPELSLPGNPPRVIFPNLPDNWRLRLAASLPLYTGGRLERIAEAAGGEAAAAAHDAQTARADLAYETAAAYWSLVTAGESERVLREALASYGRHLQDARNRETFGLAARNEVLAVEVERSRADLLRLEAANQAAVAEANLARLLGLPPAARVLAEEPLEPGQEPAGELEPLVAAALAERPERAALLARVGAADARARAEAAGHRPQVALAAGFDYADPNRRILPPKAEWETSWDVGVALSWNLFDGGRTAANRARAEARADVVRQQLQDLDRRVRLEVTRARLDADSARARVAVAEQAREAARENLRVASERHREGVSPSTERLDAETRLLRAGLDRTYALAAARVAEAAMLRALGRVEAP